MRGLVVVAVVVGSVVAGCGVEPEEDVEQMRSAVPSTAAAAPEPASRQPVGNPRLHARATRLLEAAGVREVAEVEPSHGSPAEALSGVWRGRQVRAGVVPTRRATAPTGRIRSYSVQGRQVRVLDSPPYLVHQVEVGPDTWGVVVVDDDSMTQALVEAMVAAAEPPTAPADPAAMVAHADNLYGVRVTRSGDRLDVTSLWGIGCDHDGCEPAVLVTREGDAAPSYRVGSHDDLQRALWTTGAEDTPNPFGAGMLSSPAVSLRPGVEALVGGGDGATLFPFEMVARSGGRPQQVTEPDGAFTGGTVVLGDGRMLTLLTAYVDERLGQLNDRHHGLWASDGDDWTRYAPHQPSFEPELTDTPKGTVAFRELGATAEDPVIWLQTWDQRVYVSTDDAMTFREIDVR